MKTVLIKKSHVLLFILSIACSFAMNAQIGGWKPELTKDSQDALKKMKDDYPTLNTYYDKSYAYVVFPKVTKAGLGIGGAAGKGIVFKGEDIIGMSSLKQASIGLQAGGQQYSEVIFFENKKAFDHFANGNLKFDAQASAVALEKGVSADVAYKDGVAVFTNAIGGLMFEASIGGQHFSYKEKK